MILICSFSRDFYEKEFGIPLEKNLLSIEKLLTNLKLFKDNNLTLSGLLVLGKSLKG